MMFVWDGYLRAGLFRRRWLRQLDTMTSDIIEQSHDEVLLRDMLALMPIVRVSL